MEITWFGHSCFRLRGKDATVLMDPPTATPGKQIPPQMPNVVTISHDHPGHNDRARYQRTCPVIDGPGEYEVAGVFVQGIRTYHDGSNGAQRGKNVAYSITIDDITVCHLGDLGHPLSADQREHLGTVHVLLVPVGGYSTISASQAAEVVNAITPRPKYVIPMHYRDDTAESANLAPVEQFLKEMGKLDTAPQPKLTITKSGFPTEDQAATQVVILEPGSARGGTR